MDNLSYKIMMFSVCFLLFGIVSVFSDEQCDCKTMSLLKELVQQEIVERKFENIRLRFELKRISERLDLSKPTPVGITSATDLKKDNRLEALELRFAEFEKNAKEKLTMTKAFQKEKMERIIFKQNMSEQFDNFKKTLSIRFEEQAEQAALHFASGRNDSELFKRNISDRLSTFEVKIRNDLKENELQTASDVTTILINFQNTSDNINECIADIGAIKVDIDEITEAVKSNKNAVLGLRNKREERIEEVDRKFSHIVKRFGICREGWERHGEKCYYFSTDTKSWNDAAKECNVLNGHLVEIRNANENSYVFSKIKNANNQHHFWIGLNDRALEGTFRWESSSLKTADDMFTNWNNGEPNDEHGEDCTKIYITNGFWNDFSCQESIQYICESLPEI